MDATKVARYDSPLKAVEPAPCNPVCGRYKVDWLDPSSEGDVLSHDADALLIPVDVGSLAVGDGLIGSRPFFVNHYPRSQHQAFFEEIAEKIAVARRIKLIATGLNLIWEDRIREMLFTRVVRGEAHVTICMGNTSSPHVRDRLVEEEVPRFAAEPDLAAQSSPPAAMPIAGARGIDRHIDGWVDFLARNPQATLDVRLFESYPTFATLILDDDIYVCPYGYQVLGTSSPIFHFAVQDPPDPAARFLLDNADRILAASVPAHDVVRRRHDSHYRADEWVQAAAFLLPPAESALHRLGSELLGYDLRTGKSVERAGQSGWLQSYVGEAAEYGLHATLADALYFPTADALHRVMAEVESIASSFDVVELDELTLAEGLQDDSVLALTAIDPSGSVEAMHFESLARVNTAAISSAYLVGSTKKRASREQQRDKLMLDRYGSSYILSAYRLHFTLLSSLPLATAPRRDVVDRTAAFMSAAIRESTVELTDLGVVVKRPGDTHWRLERVFGLRERRP